MFVTKSTLQNAIKWMFSFPSGEPQGKDGNQKIRDKCKQYLDRVEELQGHLVNKEIVKENEIEASQLPSMQVSPT